MYMHYYDYDKWNYGAVYKNSFLFQSWNYTHSYEGPDDMVLYNMQLQFWYII